MTYHHRYPEEVRLDAINRAVSALKRRLYEHRGNCIRQEGKNPLGPDPARAVEKVTEATRRGED